MIGMLYERMMIPGSCKLGKKVYKKLFLENAKLTSSDKNALQNDVESIFWQYTFKSTTIPIQPYEDDIREYHEVALLEVNLKKEKRVDRLCEMIHRTIPYPLLLIFCFSDQPSEIKNQKCLLSLANKRFSHADRQAIVAEEFASTPWLDLANATENQGRFLKSLDVSTWPHTHFHAFYQAAMERVIALACSDHTGVFSLGDGQGFSGENRFDLLQEIDKLEQEQSEIQRKLRGEKNLGYQVQLNTQKKHARDRIEVLKSRL